MCKKRGSYDVKLLKSPKVRKFKRKIWRSTGIHPWPFTVLIVHE